jgi:hypothetical protein
MTAVTRADHIEPRREQSPGPPRADGPTATDTTAAEDHSSPSPARPPPSTRRRRGPRQTASPHPPTGPELNSREQDATARPVRITVAAERGST